MRSLATSLVALAALLSACTEGATPTAAPAPSLALSGIVGTGQPSLIQSQLTSNRCLNVRQALTTDGTPIMTFACYTTAANEQFTWNAAGEIRTIGNKCLADNGGKGNDGDAIVIWTCNGSTSQHWTNTAQGEIRGINNKCVAVAGANAAEGAAVVLQTCNGATSQSWDQYGAAAPPPPPPPPPASGFYSVAHGGIRPRGFGQGTYALLSPVTGGTTYYVATTGSDANAGTSASPFRTINKAAQVARAGDVVTIRSGTYQETVQVRNSGTTTAPVVFQAETRGGVVLTGGAYRFQPAGWTNNYNYGGQQYVTVRGLIFRQYSPTSNPNLHAVEAVGGWTIDDCLFDQAGYTAIEVMGPNVTIIRSTIQNTFLLAIGSYIDDAGSTSPSDPLYHAVDNLHLTDVVLWRNATTTLTTATTGPGYSMKLIQTRGLVIDNIESYENRGPGLWLDSNHSNWVIRNSFFHNNINALGTGATGIGRGIHVEKSWGPGLIEGNVFYDNESAAIFVNNSQGITIRNNLSSGNTQCVLFVNTDGYPHDLKNISIFNNQCRDWKQYAGIHTLGGTFTSPAAMAIKADSNVYQPMTVGSLGYWQGIPNAAVNVAQMQSYFGWESRGSMGTVAKP